MKDLSMFGCINWLAAVVSACVLLTQLGCGGADNVGTVTGKVTLDGEPLADADITFAPQAGGGMSFATTGSDGSYSLMHQSGSTGAVIGTHVVTITTAKETEEIDEEGEPNTIVTPEKVPAKYNDSSELTATVAAGSNTCDFALTTGDDASAEEGSPE